MEYRYQIGGEIKTVKVEREGDIYRVSLDGAPSRSVRVTGNQPHALDLEMDGQRRRVHVVHDGQRHLVAIGSDVYELRKVERGSRRRAAVEASNADNLTAQMPGQVVSVAVREGDAVTKGQTLVILEAMKMELRVTAPYAGHVARVLVAQGQVVERGQRLVEIVASNQ